MLAIYNYVPQTHHVCTVRTAAAILQLQFMLHVMLLLLLLFIILMLAIYNYVPQTQHVCTACSINYSCSYSAATVYATCIIIIIYHLNAGYLQLCTTNTTCLYSTYCCSYSAATVYATCNVISNVECSVDYCTLIVSAVCLQWQVWLISVVPWFSDFPGCCSSIVWRTEMVPVATVIAGTIFIFTFHIRRISIVRYLYIKNLPSFFLEHICLLKFPHLLASIFLFIINDYDVRFIFSNRYCQFALVGSI